MILLVSDPDPLSQVKYDCSDCRSYSSKDKDVYFVYIDFILQE